MEEKGWLNTMLFFGLLVVAVSSACWCACFLQRRLGHYARKPGHYDSKRCQNRTPDKATQTNAIVIRRYWGQPRDMVISLAIRRGIPGASRPRATRAELASLLIEQDLGRCFDRSQC